jgi:hypothetical protein
MHRHLNDMRILHLLHKGLPVTDNIRVSHDFEHLNFSERLLNLFFLHLGDVDDLNGVVNTLMMNCFLLFLDSTRTAKPKLPLPTI